MAYMGKQDNIFEGGNLSGLPFTFNQEVTEVFEDMIDRSVQGYKTSLSLIAHNAKKYYQRHKRKKVLWNDKSQQAISERTSVKKIQRDKREKKLK